MTDRREQVYLDVTDILAALRSGCDPRPLARHQLRESTRAAAWRMIRHPEHAPHGDIDQDPIPGT